MSLYRLPPKADDMIGVSQSKVSYVRGADGSPLALSDLPAAHAARWTARHKTNIVAAVRGGLIGLEDVCRGYSLSVEEFIAWSEAIDRCGLSGLRATRIQQYRHKT